MAENENKAVITKEELKKEIRRESRRYRRRKGLVTFAVLLVLVAAVLLFIFAKNRGLLNGEGFSVAKLIKELDDAIQNYDGEEMVKQMGTYLEPNKEIDEIIDDVVGSEEDITESRQDTVQNTVMEDDEIMDGELLSKNTLVIKGSDIIYEGKDIKDIDELKDVILNEELGVDDVITLKEEKAITSVYLDVKDLLDELEDVQYIEE